MTSVGPGEVHPLHVEHLHRVLVDELDAEVGLRVHPHLLHDVPGAGEQLELVDVVVGLVEDVDAHAGSSCATGASAPTAYAVGRGPADLLRWPARPCAPLRVLVPAGVVALVGVDDGADETVPHHVVRGELGEVDVLDVTEDVAHDLEAGTGAAGEVDLGDVAGDDHLRAEAEPGQEHLHLLARGVLRLVEDDEGVVEGATTHVRQRGDLDRAGRHELGDRLGRDHVVESVVERSQVGVDLVVEGAREEAEALTGLDGRAGQDDAVDLLGLQGGDGLGHREVGLAGAGRADAEDDRVLVDGVDVALLVQRLGPDRATAVADDVHRQHVGRPLDRLVAQHRDGALDGVAVERLPRLDDDEQLVEQRVDDLELARRPAKVISLPRTWVSTSGNCRSMVRSSSSRGPSRVTISIGGGICRVRTGASSPARAPRERCRELSGPSDSDGRGCASFIVLPSLRVAARAPHHEFGEIRLCCTRDGSWTYIMCPAS